MKTLKIKKRMLNSIGVRVRNQVSSPTLQILGQMLANKVWIQIQNQNAEIWGYHVRNQVNNQAVDSL